MRFGDAVSVANARMRQLQDRRTVKHPQYCKLRLPTTVLDQGNSCKPKPATQSKPLQVTNQSKPGRKLPSRTQLIQALHEKEGQGLSKGALRAHKAAGCTEKSVRRLESQLRADLPTKTLTHNGKVIGAYVSLCAKLRVLHKLYDAQSWVLAWDASRAGWCTIAIAPCVTTGSGEILHLSASHWWLIGVYKGSDDATHLQNFISQSMFDKEVKQASQFGALQVFGDWEALRSVTGVAPGRTRTTDDCKPMCHVCGITKFELTKHKGVQHFASNFPC